MNEPSKESIDCPIDNFDENEEGNLHKPDLKICEEGEDLVDIEPQYQCVVPQLIEAKVMIPEVCKPKEEQFARFFDVKEIGKTKL